MENTTTGRLADSEPNQQSIPVHTPDADRLKDALAPADMGDAYVDDRFGKSGGKDYGFMAFLYF